MKQVLLFAFLFCASFSIAFAAQKSNQDAPEYIIIEDMVVLVTANEYMSAQYVVVSILDSNGNVQASATTQPGRTVTFSRTITTLVSMF